MKGIIFDFNGTMFQDSALHEQAYTFIVNKYISQEAIPKEKFHQIHGGTNEKILPFLFEEKLSEEKLQRIAQEKENYYRSLIEKQNSYSLTSGLEEVLNRLKINKVPMTIATGSPKENLDFYFKIFSLDRWFDRRKVVFDDGSFEGKPAPDIFLKAAGKLNLAPKECMVIEDSYLGLKAANKADIGKIIAIDPEGKNKDLFGKQEIRINRVITDFVDFYQYWNK